MEGWIIESRDLPGKRQQIFSISLPGDVIAPLAARWRATMRALTNADTVAVSDLIAQSNQSEEIEAAISRALDLASARLYLHLERLNKRSALSRVASLLVELHDRLAAVGLVRDAGFEVPLSHEQIAATLGLHAAHVTRCLTTLRQEGLLTLRHGRVFDFDRGTLSKVAVN